MDEAAPSIEELCERAGNLPYLFPRGTERVQLWAHAVPAVATMAAGVTPLCDRALEALLDDFLEAKREHGSPAELELYAAMTRSALLTRLLQRRPLGFWGPNDRYVLETTRDAQGYLTAKQWAQEQEGAGNVFEAIGTEAEAAPLVLSDYLSYDEMALAALVSVAVPTRFISTGDRKLINDADEAVAGAPGSFEPEGVLVGCVGARLVKPGRMEALHVLVGPERTGERVQAPLLRAWARFYGEHALPTYEQAQALPERFHPLPCEYRDCAGVAEWRDQGQRWCAGCMRLTYKDATWPGEQVGPTYLDTQVYKLRICRSVGPLLAYASAHGSARGGAHVRVKGLGLGAWAVPNLDLLLKALMKAVYQELLDAHEYPGIAVLDFAWFGAESLPTSNRIRVLASKAAFADPVEPGLALVTMYCWDGNAYPGNEWWSGLKAATDDSAAASCSLISSLQHPRINPERVQAGAARVLDRGALRPLQAKPQSPL